MCFMYCQSLSVKQCVISLLQKYVCTTHKVIIVDILLFWMKHNKDGDSEYCMCVIPVVDELENVVSVRVQEEEIKYGSMGYIVILIMAGGYSLGVTEVATNDDKRCVYYGFSSFV